MVARTRVHILLPVILLLGAVPGTGTSAAAEEIGQVKTVSGAATLVRAGTALTTVVGTTVEPNDVLRTGSGGALGVTFKDNTVISVGPDTELTIDDFVYRPMTKDVAFVSTLARGTLHYISGAIGKISPEQVAVKVPGGTIGIRGTRFVVRVDD